MLWVVTTGVALAVVATAVSSHQRHRRLRARVRRLERVETELLRARKRLYSLECEFRGRAASTPVRFSSLYGEDLLVWDLFEPKRDGFFIECGAYDGVFWSVTDALERIGWTGLLVEPIPELARAAERARPGSRVVNAAVSRRGSSGTTKMMRIVGGQRDEVCSYLPGQSRGPKTVAERGLTEEEISVRLTTLEDLLDGHEGPIDLAVIDVEGAELDVLDGLNLDRYRPRALIVEDAALGDDAGVPRYLGRFGYEHVAWIGINRLLVNRDDAELLERAKEICGNVPFPTAVHR